MAEPSKDKFDPDATVRQPAAAEPDPEATVRMPAGPDPDATFSGPAAKPEPDPESTIRGPLFDPDATVNPAGDPEATVRIPSPGRLRKNPFAPSAPLSSLHTSLASLGGLNPLVELANSILGAVPQIRHSLRHPDPARLRAMLRDQIEAFRSAAQSEGHAARSIDSAVDALCALLDESAASTPWGADWKRNGIAKDLARAGAADATFTATLQRVADDAGADADLVEFLYVCLALGFEGRRDLDACREKLYVAAARRRPRPAELSENWHSVAAAAPDFLLEPEPQPEPVPEPAPEPVPPKAPAPSLSPAPGEVRYEAPAPPRFPRAVVVRAALGVAAALVVGFILVLRLIEDDVSVDTRPRPGQAAAPVAAAAAPASVSAAARLGKALEGQPVAVSESAGRVTLSLRLQNQFGSGAEAVGPALQPVLRSVAQALDGVPGAITVVGHTDAVPVRSAGRHASNQELSLARARAAAAAIAASLGDPRRVKAEGKGDAEPVAPSDTPQNRALNRRIVIVLSPAP